MWPVVAGEQVRLANRVHVEGEHSRARHRQHLLCKAPEHQLDFSGGRGRDHPPEGGGRGETLTWMSGPSPGMAGWHVPGMMAEATSPLVTGSCFCCVCVISQLFCLSTVRRDEGCMFEESTGGCFSVLKGSPSFRSQGNWQ